MAETANIPYPVGRLKLKTGVEMAYLDEGQGPFSLLLVHGLGSNLKCWQKLITHLAPHFRCIAVDLPGYGWSSKGDYPFSMSFFADSLAEFMELLALKPVGLVGHSMGAQIAMTLALQAPGKIQELVLLAPAGFETFSEAEQDWLRRLFQSELLMAQTPEQIRRNFAVNFHRFPEDAEFMIADRMALRGQPEAYRAFCRMVPQCVAGMLREPVFDRLPEICHPSLVIFGEEDLLIPNRVLHPQLTSRKVAEAGAGLLPHSQLVMLRQCGHFLPWEGAGEIASLIRSFFHPD